MNHPTFWEEWRELAWHGRIGLLVLAGSMTFLRYLPAVFLGLLFLWGVLLGIILILDPSGVTFFKAVWGTP